MLSAFLIGVGGLALALVVGYWLGRRRTRADRKHADRQLISALRLVEQLRREMDRGAALVEDRAALNRQTVQVNRRFAELLDRYYTEES